MPAALQGCGLSSVWHLMLKSARSHLQCQHAATQQVHVGRVHQRGGSRICIDHKRTRSGFKELGSGVEKPSYRCVSRLSDIKQCEAMMGKGRSVTDWKWQVDKCVHEKRNYGRGEKKSWGRMKSLRAVLSKIQCAVLCWVYWDVWSI